MTWLSELTHNGGLPCWWHDVSKVARWGQIYGLEAPQQSASKLQARMPKTYADERLFALSVA